VTEREHGEGGADRLKELELMTLIWNSLRNYEQISGAKIYWVEYFDAGVVIHHEPKDAPPKDRSPEPDGPSG
jgi:hypothetical protein